MANNYKFFDEKSILSGSSSIAILAVCGALTFLIPPLKNQILILRWIAFILSILIVYFFTKRANLNLPQFYILVVVNSFILFSISTGINAILTSKLFEGNNTKASILPLYKEPYFFAPAKLEDSIKNLNDSLIIYKKLASLYTMDVSGDWDGTLDSNFEMSPYEMNLYKFNGYIHRDSIQIDSTYRKFVNSKTISDSQIDFYDYVLIIALIFALTGYFLSIKIFKEKKEVSPPMF